MGSLVYLHFEWIFWSFMAIAAAIVTAYFFYDGSGNSQRKSRLSGRLEKEEGLWYLTWP